MSCKTKQDIHCRNSAAQPHHKDKNTFNLVMIFPDGLLQKQQYAHGLKYDVIIAPHSMVPVILHEFHNSKGHQGTILTFEAIRRFYWWAKLCQDILKHINRWSICAKKISNMAKFLQQHLEILKVVMTVLAMDTIGHLPVISRGHQLSLTAICMHTPYVVTVPMKEKSAGNVMQSYLSGIFAHKGGSITILSE